MRQELKTKVLRRNRVQCKNCGDIIESKRRHDFVTCACGNVNLDGGLVYRRVGWPGDGGDPSDFFEDLCEYEEVTDELLRNIKFKRRCRFERSRSRRRK